MKNENRFKIILLLTLVCGICLGLLLQGSPAAREQETAAAFSRGAADVYTAAPSAAAPETLTPPTTAQPVNVFMMTTVETPGQEETAELRPSTTAALPMAETPAPTKPGFVIEVLSTPESSKAVKKILIYHTHTYEAYRKPENQQYEETEQWRTADARYNMVRVGEELAALLRGLGYQAVHDQTAFEPPELSTAYARSLAMLEQRKAAGEKYDLYIDLHRDAYIAGQGAMNTVSTGGGQAARLLLLVGRGDGQTTEGFSEKPRWEENQKIAQRITDHLNRQAEGLCKEVRLKSGRFNQHIDVGCILVEVGNNQNTLEEALLSMPYLADAIQAALEETAE